MKAPTAPMFAMPQPCDVAAMLRADLADVRRHWLAEPKHDAAERLRREQSDFLVDENQDGRLDFHALRHTCGAWLAMQGAHPKLIQTVMRHSSITLTMDTYGHLFPGQEADAVARMREMPVAPPEALRATGTDNAAADIKETAQRQAQRETRRTGVTRCGERTQPAVQKESPELLQIVDLGERRRCDALPCESSGGGTRTPDTRIMIPLL